MSHTPFRYKAVGPRGAEYLCSTYAEALSKAADPLQITLLSKGKGKRKARARGRPARLRVLSAGDRVFAASPWIAVGGPTAHSLSVSVTPRRVSAGTRLQVGSASRGVINYTFRDDPHVTYSMTLNFFMERVRPLEGNPLHGLYQTLYEILNVEQDADLDTIKKAWREKLRILHPDALYQVLGHPPSAKEIKEATAFTQDVNYAYDILKDEAKRKNYDTYGDPEVGHGAPPGHSRTRTGTGTGTGTGTTPEAEYRPPEWGNREWWWHGNLRSPSTHMSPRMLEGNEDALFNYITSDRYIFESAIQKTGRFITKSILAGHFDPRSAPSVWYCAVMSAVRNWALSKDIKPTEVPWDRDARLLERSPDKKPAEVLLVYGKYTPDKIAAVARRVSDWFFGTLRDGYYNLEDVFRVFGSVDVTGKAGDWDINFRRDPIESPDFNFGETPSEDLDDDDEDDPFGETRNPRYLRGEIKNPEPSTEMERKANFLLETISRKKFLIKSADGTERMVAFFDLPINDKAAWKKKILAQLEQKQQAEQAPPEQAPPEQAPPEQAPPEQAPPEQAYEEPRPEISPKQRAMLLAAKILKVVKEEIEDGSITSITDLKTRILYLIDTSTVEVSSEYSSIILAQVTLRTKPLLPASSESGTKDMSEDVAKKIVITAAERVFKKTINNPVTYCSDALEDMETDAFEVFKYLYYHELTPKEVDRYVDGVAAYLILSASTLSSREAKAAKLLTKNEADPLWRTRVLRTELRRKVRHEAYYENVYYVQLVPKVLEYGTKLTTFDGDALFQFSPWLEASKILEDTTDWMENALAEPVWIGNNTGLDLTKVWYDSQVNTENLIQLSRLIEGGAEGVRGSGGKLEIPRSFTPLKYSEGFKYTLLLQFPDTSAKRFVPYNTLEPLSYVNIHTSRKSVIRRDFDGNPIKERREYVDREGNKAWKYATSRGPSILLSLFNKEAGLLGGAGEFQSDEEEIVQEPWRIPRIYNMEAFTKEALEILINTLKGESTAPQFEGTPLFAIGAMEEPRNLEIVRAASNLEIYIPDTFKILKVPFPKDSLRPSLKSLYDIFTLTMNPENESTKKMREGLGIERINAHEGKRQHYLLPFINIGKLQRVLEGLPGFSTERSSEVLEDARRDLREKKAQLDWAQKQKEAGTIKIKEGVTIYPYQENGIIFLMGHKVGILADDRGLGKTLQSIIAAENVKAEFFPNDPVLILTPANLVPNYNRELEKFALDSSGVYTLTGGARYTNQAELDKGRNRRTAEGRLEIPTVSFIPNDANWIIVSQSTAKNSHTVVSAIVNKNAQAVLSRPDPSKPLSKGASQVTQDFYYVSKRLGTARPSEVAKGLATWRLQKEVDNPRLAEKGFAQLNGVRYRLLDLKNLDVARGGGPVFLIQEANTRYKIPLDRATADMLLQPSMLQQQPNIKEDVEKILTIQAQLYAETGNYGEMLGFAQAVTKLKLPSAITKPIIAILKKIKLMEESKEDGWVRSVILTHDWPLVIIDESHGYKNESTANFAFAKELAKNAERVWLMTGTPIANRLSDLWTSLYLASHPEGVGRNARKFQHKYSVMNGDKEVGTKNIARLKSNTRDIMLWRNKDDVAQIPVQTVYKRDMKIPPNQLMHYMGEGPFGPLWMDLSKVGYNKYTRDMYGIEKMAAMAAKAQKQIAIRKAPFSFHEAMAAIREGKKTILFSSSSGQLLRGKHKEAAQKKFGTNLPIQALTVDGGAIPWLLEMCIKQREEDPKFGYIVLTGYGVVVSGKFYSVTSGAKKAENVQMAVDMFSNDPNIKLFIGNTQSAGTGLNLQAATYTVFNDFEYQPARMEQAEDRTRRINQTKCTSVVYTVAINCAIEREKWDVLQSKRKDIERLQAGRDVPDMWDDPSASHQEEQLA